MNPLHVVFGAGPAGLATVEALVRRGLRVRIVSRSSRPELPEGVELVHGDASDADFTGLACEGASVVYQTLGAPYDKWPELFPPMQRGVIAGARAANARLVTLENLYGYGPVDEPMTESMPLIATTRKGRTRAEMTRELLASGLEIAIARASDFFGPNVLLASLGDRVLGPLAKGKAAQVLGDPDTLHTYTYIHDLGEALAILGTRPEAVGRVWHVPSIQGVTTRQAVGALAEAMGQKGRVSAAPKAILWLASWVDPMVREVLEMHYQFERDFVMDDSAFRETFGMQPTPLEQAAAETVAWFEEHDSAARAA